jgi:hypothetical protein
MPSEEDIRRYQEEHPVGDEIRKLVENVPLIPFNPQAMRQRMLERFRNQALGVPWEKPEEK